MMDNRVAAIKQALKKEGMGGKVSALCYETSIHDVGTVMRCPLFQTYS